MVTHPTSQQIKIAVILRRAQMPLSTAEIGDLIEARQENVLKSLTAGIPNVVEVDGGNLPTSNGRPARYWMFRKLN